MPKKTETREQLLLEVKRLQDEATSKLLTMGWSEDAVSALLLQAIDEAQREPKCQSQNARVKTTAIRQTLDAIGTDLSHEVVDGKAKIETAETITLIISDKSGSELFRTNTKILKKEVS